MRERKVILVEDDPAISEALALLLEKWGYQVGAYASAEAFEQHSPLPADLFLIDRHLSGIDGLELCRRLKSEAATMHIPVVILSASPQVAEYSRQAGADGFLEKPFTRSTLLELLKRLLDNGSSSL